MEEPMFEHRTVLLEEAVTGLNIKADGIYVDCTLGGGGHSELILSKLGAEGRLVAIDQDIKAIENAKERLAWSGKQINFVQRNFKYIKEIIESLEIAKVDGIVYDLGISSPQVDEGERGFSYWSEATLDMRMDKSAQLTAHEIVNCWDESELIRIIYEYGEERFAKRIAQSIIRERQIKSIETTTVLADIVKNSIPAATRRTGGHPARRTFQAIRIAVNDELNVFKESLIAAINLLNAGGRISVITFHSLEDRICKEVFNEYAGGCICPPDLPICGCGIKPTIKIITKKPVVPSALEIAENPRARSAKLRIIERLVP
ncbi:MAG: 16S rRNA (cytosine(1402)-N(4))-methyltransferase RsmH [Anaerovoracaceae bacterium]